MSGLQLLITLSVLPFMVLTGIYLYRYLNNKLQNARTWFQIIGFGILLFAGIGSVCSGGLLLMIWLYDLFSL
ncbi:hypothetical protein A8C56_05835 [Niabella ginsenosidivorans]|uniref:Uncharacterized protein n=1 Tax=Niabella ginsenosidivorans TaxID=1176587 RepID=A0A1A9I1J5_9BACT|nr:hypothetical protein [Niabella ginsenosidivorans]ANH80571.1 hypothetical protein A8C56_05835 [Niabella ginsenosidivorans]